MYDLSLFSLALGNNHGLETVYLTRFKVCIECLRVNIFCKNQRFVDLGGLQDFPAKSNTQGLVGVPHIGRYGVLRGEFFGELSGCKSYTMSLTKCHAVVIDVKLGVAN